MATTSTCVNCGASTFELAPLAPSGSQSTLSAIRCATCGGVVSVLEALNMLTIIRDLAQRINRLSQDLDARLPPRP
jgi:hypothetical protein